MIGKELRDRLPLYCNALSFGIRKDDEGMDISKLVELIGIVFSPMSLAVTCPMLRFQTGSSPHWIS